VRVSANWERRVRALGAYRDGAPGSAAILLTDDPLLKSVPPLPVDPEFWVASAHIARAADDRQLTERVSELAGQLLAAGPGSPLLYGTGQHVLGLLGGDARGMARAAATLRDAGRPLLEADAARDAGEALRTAGEPQEAREMLETALHAYLAHGALADARRANNSLRQLGAGRRISAAPRPRHGWDSLTPSERKVAELIAAGRTNREAAQELFISPHTVSSHLRAAFDKLGVHSRVQLTRLVTGRGKPGDDGPGG
jgi:DNA-binding CsgD family transcriptional regulator